MNETLKKYYEYLRGAGADAPDTFESFSSTLEDPQNSEKYFNYLQSSGFDTPESYDAFVTTLGLKKKDEPAALPTIQEDIYGVSRMPADYLQQPSEEKPEPSSPVDAILEKNYEERGWPSPSKKFNSWESGVRALSGEIDRGEIQPDEFNSRILSLANLIGLDYDVATGTASLPQAERDIYEQQQRRAYQQFIQDRAAKEKEGFMKDVLDNLNIGSQSVMTSPVRALAMSERIANGVIGLVDKKKKLSSTYWQDKAATEASVLDLWRSQNVRYDSDIAGAIREGNMGAAVGQTVLSIAENLPLLATLALGNGAGATNVTLGYMGFDKGADEYLRSTADTNMTELSRWVNFAVKGMSEVVFEGIGTVPILNSVRKGIAEVGQATMRDQLIRTYSPLLQKSFAMLNKGMSAAVREGGSEAATQLVDNLMDMSLGRDVKIGDGVFDSFVVGAAIGQGMVTPQMVAEYKGGQNALVKQIASSIPENLDYEKKVELAQLLVESAQIKYDQGKKVAGMDAVNKIRLEEIQNRVAEIMGVPIEPAGEQTIKDKFIPSKQNHSEEPGYFKGISRQEAINLIDGKVSDSQVPLIFDEELVEDLGITEEETNRLSEEEWNKSSNLTTDFQNAKGYGGAVIKVDEANTTDIIDFDKGYALGKDVVAKAVYLDGKWYDILPSKQITKPAGEQKPIETGGVKDAESVGVKTEEAGAEAAPGMVEGMEGGVRLRDTAEDRVEAEQTIETPRGAKIIVAPFYDTKIKSIEEAAILRESEPYKRQQQQIKDVAEIMGVKIKEVSENIGGFVNEQGNKIIEISNTITIDGTIEQAEAFAAVMGAMSHEAQEATIAGVYVEPNSATHGIDEMSIPVGDINGAIEALATAGITDYTINETEGTVQILDFSKGEDAEFGNKITNFVNALSEKGITYGKQERRAVDSRYIDPDTRRDILGRISQDPVYQRQGGAGFRTLMERAQARDQDFRSRTRGESRGEVTTEENLRNIVKSLGLTFPDVTVILADDIADARIKLKDELTKRGAPEDFTSKAVKQFDFATGGQAIVIKNKPAIIVLNKEIARASSIGHEMWHFMLDAAFLENPGRFRELAVAIDKQLRASGREDMANDLKRFASSYRGDVRFIEYMAELGGRLTAAGITRGKMDIADRSLIEKIRDILNKFARALVGKDLFLKDATPENILDFMIAISQRMAKGESVADFLVEGQALPSTEGVAARRQSISIMKGEESMKKYGLDKGKNTVRRVGEALEARQRAKYGTIGKNDRSEAAERKIASWMVKEISYWVDLCEREGINSGRGWYGKLFQESLDIFAEAFPRLKSDQNARDMFTMLLAITSDGQKIMQNFKLAAQAYQQWEKTGRVPDKLPALRTASIIGNLANLNNMLIEHGGDVAKMKETLLRIQPVKDINKELRRRGMNNMSWPADFKVPVASGIFGPKLGMYFANLSGVENYPTLDRWWSRMFNRYRGTLIPEITRGLDAKGNAMGLDRLRELMGNSEMTDEEVITAAISFRNTYAAKGFKNGTEIEKAANTIYTDAFETLNDAPFNTSDRGFMYRSLSRAVKNINRQGFNFTIADAQAALWYYEKNLYKRLGVKANIEGISYADAARESIRKFHEAGDKFTYAVKKNEDVSSVENADNDIDADEIVIRSQLITPLESPEIKRIKSHIRKMVLQAHGVDIMEKRAQAAYDIGAAEEKLIRDIEEGKDKAARKRAIETYRQLSKFISRAIKEADFATKLSKVQTRMIVNEARRVKDLDTLQDFFATLDKIVDNTQYAAAMNNARTAQREIRKRVASGRYGKDTQMVLDFATMPLRVRDFEMEDLEEFNKVAELLLAGKVPADGVTALRSYKPPQITEPLKVGLRKMINEMDGPEDFERVYDAISGLDVSSLNKLERALGAVAMARERLSEMSGEESDLGEMEDRLDDLELQLENKATEFAEELEEEKRALIEESKTLAEDVDLESFYPEERIEVKKILDMREDELMRMTPKQIFLYRDIVHGLTEGFVNKEMYMFIQEMDVTLKRASWDVITAHLQNGYKKIRELGDKFAKANMRFIAKWIDPLRINEDFLTNVFNLSKMNVVDQKVLGIYDKNAKPIYENFIAPLMRAVTTMDRDVEQAMNTYYAATKKVSKEEREMLGMLMAERDFRSGSIIIGGQEYTWDELPEEEKKDLFRWAVENRSKSMRHDVMDIMRVRKEMVLDEQGNIDLDASLDKMVKKNPAVSKLMAAARTIIDSQKGKARVAAEMRGDVFEDEGPDYFPRLVAESLNRQDPKMIEKGNIDSMTSPYRAVRKRAKSSFNRTHGRHATEYDLDRVIGFYVYDVNRDYHLSRPITAISVALHRVAATSEVEDSAQVAAALRRSIVDRIKVELAERSKIPVLSKLVNWKRTLALAQPERPMIEFTANAIRYYAENPSARVGRMTDPRWKAVAKLMASPISLKRLSRYDSELMTEDREGFLERGAKLLYTAADTYAGRLVYGNEFDKAFKEKTGEKFDIDRFIADEQYRIDNKEALAHADAMAMNMIESLYNSQSWATGPSQHRYLPGTTSKEMLSSKKSFIAQTLGYMQSFNFGETEEALNAIRAIARPGVSSAAKARAGRRLLNLMVSNYIYMALRGAIFVMLNSAIDDEDDMLESLGNYFSFKNQWKMFVGSVATLGMGRHGALVRLATSVGLGFADYANEDSESLRLIVDTANQSINARPINPNKRMRFVDFVDQVGMIWGDIAADLARMGMSAVDLYKQVSEKGIDSLTLDQKETWVALSTMNQILALAVPNFVSPVAERVIRAFRYSVGPDYQVDPDKKARTVNGTDIKDLYKLAPVSGMTSKAITIYSTGERMDNKREISDGELKKYQSLAREKFDAYVREYTVNNRGVIAAEAQAGTVSDARSDEVQKDINELWKKAKKQAQIELYEYPSAKRHSEYSRVVKYGALPEPISEAERTVDGERVNMMMDPALAKEVNKTFIRLYLEWFNSHYATEAAVKSDKRDIQENGKSKFDNDVNEAVKKLRAEAKSQHLK